MLITFKSKSSAKLLMLEEHAQQILDVLHKSPTRGVITAAETGAALSQLEHQIALSKQVPETTVDVEHDMHALDEKEEDQDDHAPQRRVGFATRAFPLLEMLREAQKHGEDVVWGV